jgi:hypothetical protein
LQIRAVSSAIVKAVSANRTAGTTNADLAMRADTAASPAVAIVGIDIDTRSTTIDHSVRADLLTRSIDALLAVRACLSARSTVLWVRLHGLQIYAGPRALYGPIRTAGNAIAFIADHIIRTCVFAGTTVLRVRCQVGASSVAVLLAVGATHDAGAFDADRFIRALFGAFAAIVRIA